MIDLFLFNGFFVLLIKYFVKKGLKLFDMLKFILKFYDLFWAEKRALKRISVHKC